MGEVAAGAGGDCAAQSGAVDDSHGVDNGGLTYRGVLEVENGECETQCPPRLSFALYRLSNYEVGA